MYHRCKRDNLLSFGKIHLISNSSINKSAKHCAEFRVHHTFNYRKFDSLKMNALKVKINSRSIRVTNTCNFDGLL